MRLSPSRRAVTRSLLGGCLRAQSVDEACAALADDLVRAGFELPSIYLLNGTRLRCRAARGYFQVVDGFRAGTGVIGRVVQTGRAELIPDVTTHPEFIAAVPELQAEAVAPVLLDGTVVGAVSVESVSELPPDTLPMITLAAEQLAAALRRLGGLPPRSLAQYLAEVSIELTGSSDPAVIRRKAALAAASMSGMAGAAVVAMRPHRPDTCVVVQTVGRMGPVVSTWTGEQLAVLASWVGPEASSHFPGGDRLPAGYDFLRDSQVASLSVHPLVVGGVSHGLLVLVSDEPVLYAGDVVDCLDLLAGQTAAALSSATALAEMSRRAERDELTGLGNRSAMMSAVREAVERCDSLSCAVGLLLLDLDDFKHVNDWQGHHLGDRLLVEVAKVISSSIRQGDVACRLGGDEFAVVLPETTLLASTAVADRILEALRDLAPIEGTNLQTSASIGVVVSSLPAVTPAELLKSADLAMYAAKSRGKGRWELFEADLQEAASDRLRLESDLRTALESDRLHLVFQPIVDVSTGAMTAVEALCRWDHPHRGQVPPSQFIPLAEDAGLIVALGGWVLEAACSQLLEWTARGLAGDLRMAVNVSTRQLESPALLSVLDACLARGVDPAQLVLEITETALAADAARVAAGLRAVRERGVHLAVDDFGTGYSSLSRLGSAPISRLKIDRSFIQAVQAAEAQVPLVEATMAMAVGLGLGVVAEGVETAEQLAYLHSLGCPEVQGFLFSRPRRAGDVEALLQGERPWQHLVEGASRATEARPVGLTHLVDVAFRPEVTLDELTGPLLRQVRAATGLEIALLTRLDVEHGRLEVVAVHGDDPGLRPGQAVDWSQSICRSLLVTGRARVEDAQQPEQETAAVAAALGARAFLSEPVYDAEGQLFGTLCATSPDPRELTDADSASLRLLAGLLSEKLRQRDGSRTDGTVKRVIVIDDDAVVRQLVAVAVESTGSSRLVGTASTAAEGISLAVAQQPDIVVLDFDLPDMPAAVVVDRVRRGSRRSRIVLHSGHSDIHAIGQRLGVDRSVCKGDGVVRLHEALQVM